MDYFLVRGTVYKTEYMGDETRFDDVRLVKAYHKIEAEEKYEEYWRLKTSEYSVYYHATGHAFETVV
jgi:hypothetical protein